MVKLVHGGDIYSARERIQGTILDFSANINPLGLPDSVKSALMELSLIHIWCMRSKKIRRLFPSCRKISPISG